ncbi:MAG TPA: hypothetical protein VFW47_14845 [Phenylobacterium sp.]|nr:hypothetical protein [Phenylobacterium sp.]
MLAAGWVIGPLRVLFFAPILGPAWSILAEAPVMLLAAGVLVWILRRRGQLSPRIFDRAVLSGAGILTVLVGEIVGSAMIYGPVGAARAFEGLPGALGLALVAVAGAMPLVARRREP